MFNCTKKGWRKQTIGIKASRPANLLHKHFYKISNKRHFLPHRPVKAKDWSKLNCCSIKPFMGHFDITSTYLLRNIPPKIFVRLQAVFLFLPETGRIMNLYISFFFFLFCWLVLYSSHYRRGSKGRTEGSRDTRR